MYYNSLAEMVDYAKRHNMKLHDVVIKNEIACSQDTEENIRFLVKERYEIMKNSTFAAANAPLKTAGALIEGIAQRQYIYSDQKDTVCGELINKAMARAFSCSEHNASMGKICAAPTAGACGVLPAVLVTVCEKFNYTEEEIINSLLVASGIGTVIIANATISGAEGGCQAECGVAAAMAAAAVVYLKGGTDDQVINSVSFVLESCMGLVCDPVAGLVQLPCALRNATQAVNALICADLSLSGLPCKIPPDEVIDAMYRVGKLLPVELRETANGGVAATPTGAKIAKQIFGK